MTLGPRADGSECDSHPPRTPAAWPLLLVAACSFIPGFGLIFGAIAVPWGMVSVRPRARLGVLIGAAGALLNVAGAFALVVLTEDTKTFTQTQAMQTARDLKTLVMALEDYHAKNGHYPPSLQALVSVPVPGVGVVVPTHFINIYDHMKGLFLPRTYRYEVAADGQSYDLFSAGPDGIPHTQDDLRPQLTDSIRAHSGYRP